ncbi:MAG: LemA family protein [bacterium]|nr:LemA family protein [bacterium]
MVELIIGIIVVIALILLFIVIIHNKFQFAIIEIEEAENNIDILLHKKKDLLNRSIPIIRKELKMEDFLKELDDKKDSDINLFELNSLLKKNYEDFFKVLDENEKLFKSETLTTIIDDINNNEIDLVAAVKFYNNSVVGFNKLVSSFPSCVFAFFRRYKKKDFYNNEKKEIFDILNDK